MKKDRKDLAESSENFAFDVIPYKRDQDLVKVGLFVKDQREVPFYCVVDGWNDLNKVDGDLPGRKIAEQVIEEFPADLLASLGKNNFDLTKISGRAIEVARELDKRILPKYPSYTGCVGAFVFDLPRKTVVVAEGTISTLVWKRGRWVKPKEIGDYVIDTSKYLSGARRFFGRRELKDDPFYSVDPDVVVLDRNVR